ncbi:MAG: DUF4384 domain-containing protein [Polyangiaceae bacterium]|nr:DUF4384 domain-containing protein [Polyangiaceae bacterium]
MIPGLKLALGVLTLASLAPVLGCSGGGGGTEGAMAGESIDCGGKPRAAADCAASKGDGSLKVSGAQSKPEETAMARINASIEELDAEQARLCESYNACSIDEAAYRAGTAPIKDRIETLKKAVAEMGQAASYGQRKRALDVAYRGVVPAEKRVEELTFRMGLSAELPASLGGGTVDIKPGSVLPTNARVVFSFEVSKDAHLYIFQRTPKDEVTVLFPDKRIGTQNPLKAGTWIEIPPDGKRFRVNEKDIGDENIYIVASQTPISSLDGALQKVKDGAVTKISEDSVLKAFTSVVPGKAPKEGCARGLEFDDAETVSVPTCTRTRGLVLDDDLGKAPIPGGKMVNGVIVADQKTSARNVPVLEVVTDPGDNVIVKVFPFKHVTEAAYPEAVLGTSRGVLIEY